MYPAAAGLASLAGGLIGSSEASDEREAAERARLAALAEYEGINVPTIEEQMLSLMGPEFVGDYEAQQEQYSGDVENALAQISLDPQYLEKQLQSLEGIGEYTEGNLTKADRGALRQVGRQVSGQDQARQQALLQEFARRGQDVEGSGLEFAARRQSSQDAAQRQAEQSDRVAQMAQQRALQALGQQATMAGNVRGQDFSEQARIKQAQTAIDQFNRQNQQSLAGRNIDRTNQASLRNLQERQRLAEQETATRNYEQEANRGLIQQRFGNELNLAAGRAGQQAGVAKSADQAAARTGQMWSGIGTGIGTGFAAMGASKAKDDDDERNIVKAF